MAKIFDSLIAEHEKFIQQQKIFFVATAGAESKINLSPKGMDSFRIISTNTVLWLNMTGSGNETSAHVQINPRMTIMFCAFEGEPHIVRLYGKAKVLHQADQEWNNYITLFPEMPGSRQIFIFNVVPGFRVVP